MAKNRHHHLDLGERHQIYALLKQGLSLRAIAKQTGRSVSTISRELARNSNEDGIYDPDLASLRALERRSAASSQPYKFSADQWETEIWSLLREGWSPEQIAGRRRACEAGFCVSKRWIYMKLARDRAAGGRLHTYLRHKGKTRRIKSDAGRSRIPNRVGIKERPAVVDEKSRVGDWEVDLIVGKNHKGYLLTVVERVTKQLLMSPLANKRSDMVKRALVKLLRPYKGLVHTITADNGMEFADHAEFGKQLGASVYFADPYSSWQRGLSEHTNGLVREYYPKSACLAALRPSDVRAVQDRLNQRPRKVLGYYMPEEVFEAALATV